MRGVATKHTGVSGEVMLEVWEEGDILSGLLSDLSLVISTSSRDLYFLSTGSEIPAQIRWKEFFTKTQFSMKAGSTDPLNCEMSLVCSLKTANSRTMRSARDKTVTWLECPVILTRRSLVTWWRSLVLARLTVTRFRGHLERTVRGHESNLKTTALCYNWYTTEEPDVSSSDCPNVFRWLNGFCPSKEQPLEN